MTAPVGAQGGVTASQERRGSSDRAFGIVFAVVFAVIGLRPVLAGGAIRPWSVALAAVFLAVALLRPRLLAPLNRAWTWLGLLLHHVVNPIVMGVIFYGVVTPIGLLLRMSGKDPLRLRLDRDAATYWIERRPPGPAPGTMRRQF